MSNLQPLEGSRPVAAWLAIVSLAVGCSSEVMKTGQNAPAAQDAGEASTPVDLADLLGHAFVALAATGDEALVMRGGAENVLVISRRQGSAQHLLGTEFDWIAVGEATVVANTCTVLDDDGLEAGYGVADGNAELNGQTSVPPDTLSGLWSSAAQALRQSLLNGETLSPENIETTTGLQTDAQIVIDLECSLGALLTGHAGAWIGAAVGGTEQEVASWWAELSPLVPKP